jgi:hypothetical protein
LQEVRLEVQEAEVVEKSCPIEVLAVLQLQSLDTPEDEHLEVGVHWFATAFHLFARFAVTGGVP